MCEQNINRNEEELKQKAMEHDMSDAQAVDIQEVGKAIEAGVVGAYQKIEDGVVSGYKKIENAVVEGYKKIEDGVVEGFGKVTDKFVEKLFAHEGESVEDAKKRLSGDKSEADQ